MSERDTELKRAIRSSLVLACEFHHAELDEEGRRRVIEIAVDQIAGMVLETDLRLMDLERAEREAMAKGFDAGVCRAREVLVTAIDNALKLPHR